ncbi:MAG: hypothetical protein JSR82_16115 [Verrucomicrobia bacterium]|nr:hypothetical protein [Verrucomicrobiota bacterium]
MSIYQLAMRSWPVAFSLLLSAPLAALEFIESNFDKLKPSEQVDVASYFGDLATLRKLLANPRPDADPYLPEPNLGLIILRSAVAGRQFQVVRVLAGRPELFTPAYMDSEHLAALFQRALSLSEFDLLVAAIPNFGTAYARDCFRASIGSGNLTVARHFKDRKIALGSLTELLCAAAFQRKEPMVRLLLEMGANPYEIEPGLRESAVTMAQKLQSAQLLEWLDRDRRFEQERKRFLAEARQIAPTNVPGLWSVPGASGFQACSIRFFTDGTGLIASGAVAPLIWREKDGRIEGRLVAFADMKDSQQFELEQVGDKLRSVVGLGGSGSNADLFARVEPKNRVPEGNAPLHLRLEAVYLNADAIWLQASGRHGRLPLATLLAGPKPVSEPGSDGPQFFRPEFDSTNTFSWAQMKPGPIPQEIRDRGIAVALTTTFASPEYRQDGQLGLDHQTIATLPPGARAALFNGHAPLAQPEHEGRVIAFPILWEKKFPHGRDNLRIYFQFERRDE